MYTVLICPTVRFRFVVSLLHPSKFVSLSIFTVVPMLFPVLIWLIVRFHCFSYAMLRLDLSHCPFSLLSLCYPPSCLSHCPFSLLSLYAAYSPSWFVSLSVFTVVPMLSPVLFVSLSVFTVVPICCIFPVLICLTVRFHCCSYMLHNLLLDLSHCPFFLFPLACLDLMSVLSCLIVGLYTFVSIASYSIPGFDLSFCPFRYFLYAINFSHC